MILLAARERGSREEEARARLSTIIYSAIHLICWLLDPGKDTFCLCLQTLLLSLDKSVQGKLPKLVHLLGPGHV